MSSASTGAQGTAGPAGGDSARKLYTTPYCGYCERVRTELDRLDLPFEEVEVGWSVSDRAEVVELTGQRRVPVLVDGDTVLHDSSRIVAYLRSKYKR